MRKMQKIYKKLHIFSSFVFFCFFLVLKKGAFRFPAANRNEGIIVSFPSFRLLSDKIIFYRDIKEKRKNAPSCGGNATQKPPFPDAKTRRDGGKVLSYYKYILCRPPKKKTAPSKKARRAGKDKKKVPRRGTFSVRSFPLDGGNGFRREVVENAVDPFYL